MIVRDTIAIGIVITATIIAITADQSALEPAYDCANGRSTDRVISLTVDGGPNEWTPQILSILQSFNVSATFFVESSQFVTSDSRQQMLRQMIANGHTIACRAQSVDQVYCQQQLIKVIGYHPVLRRPPDLTSVANQVDDARKASQIVALWNYDFADWNTDVSDADLMALYRQELGLPARTPVIDDGGVDRRNGSFIVLIQNGKRILNGMGPGRTPMLALALNLSGTPYHYISLPDCLNIDPYSSYTTPEQSTPSSGTDQTAIVYAIVFAILFAILAMAGAFYARARRKLHEQAREQRFRDEEYGLRVDSPENVFKGDRRDFEQSVPVYLDDRPDDRPIIATGSSRAIASSLSKEPKKKKDFHDLRTSHYSMAIDPHGRLRRHRRATTKVRYKIDSRPQPILDRHRLPGIRRNSDPSFTDGDELFEDMAPRPDPMALPFQRLTYGDGNRGDPKGHDRVPVRESQRDDDVDGDFRQDYPITAGVKTDLWVRQKPPRTGHKGYNG